MGELLCTACGTANPAGNKFCGECGARLKPAAGAAPTAAPDHDIKSSDDHLSRAFQFGLKGMYDEAVAEYVRALRDAPDNPELRFQLAFIYRKKGLLDNAVGELERALELDPGHFKALLTLGNICGEDLRDHYRAIEIYERAVSLMPDYPDLRNNLGNAYRFVGEYEKAVEQFEKAVDLNPAYARAFFNLGKALFKLGRLEEAELSYRRAVQIDANHPKAHKSLAVTLRALGRHAEALTPLLKAVELDPDFARAHFHLARLYDHLGVTEKSKHHAETALRLQPNLAETEEFIKTVASDKLRVPS